MDQTTWNTALVEARKYPYMQESEKDSVLNDAERHQVNEALEAILATEKFEAAPQMSAFLRYVVEQAADGNQNRIKAFTVAVDALGKPDSFDPQNDPVVRVLAGRLRSALAAYNDENTEAKLVITMTPGSYVPAFLKQQPADKESVVPAKTTTDALEPGAPYKVDGVKPEAADITESDTNALTHETSDQTQAQMSGTLGNTLQGTSDSASGKTEKPDANGSPSEGLFGKIAEIISEAPKLALTGALAIAAVIAVVHNNTDLSSEPDMQAATFAGAGTGTLQGRSRPSSPSVFISAVDRGNVLENSLNAVVSGVLSESEQIKVYRILDKEREINFWPEDYILTLTTLDLPNETRINIQLMEAETGRIVHSQAVRLTDDAFEQLTQEELANIIESSRAIVNVDGPLMKDYSSKGIANR